ncbi:hypothetical protein K2173_008963 [Erythroxylum novogranatense]|uniref:ATPase AAA-type core domain-containing protein n=1 Tax=Erythroxylum novogranatense TaxID=1862640 RepID=A0AAV8TSF7_9ROSI|nr:hypothetical protein K2173_008963 [Erythroxylum novogranatense]
MQDEALLLGLKQQLERDVETLKAQANIVSIRRHSRVYKVKTRREESLKVDSMLGRRENPGEHEAMRKMKNEFMVNWDGLRTKDKERILVLTTTNRPFHLGDSMLGRRENPGEHEAMRKMKNGFMVNWDGLRTKDKERVLVLTTTNRPFDLGDSMLGRRENPGEHEAMCKMKNEFMVNWDGLRTKDKERVLVLAATNRPFDLDEAVIRRLPSSTLSHSRNIGKGREG